MNTTLHGLPLGWSRISENSGGIGFLSNPSVCSRDLISYSGSGHLITFGPTGSGKSRSSAIPALLSHQGSAIVVDVKGELYHTTSRYRISIGQKVYKLDPWGLIGEDSDSLNPLDLLRLPRVDIEEEANVLAKMLSGNKSNDRDMFWENTSLALNAGLIAYLGTSLKEKERRLSYAREMLVKDFSYELACILDQGKMRSKLASDEFSIFLQHPERETRPSVQSTAQQYFRLLGTSRIKQAMDSSTIPLQDLIDNKPMTIYLVMPSHKLDSHNSIFRLWLGTFLQVLSRRESIGTYKTLFLVDEAAALGEMEPLKRAITLLRGYGVQVWSFWQDFSQLQNLYPNDWQTLVNNCGVIQLFCPKNQRMADEYADLVGGVSGSSVMSMSKNEQVLLTDDDKKVMFCDRMDYLTNKQYKGLFDHNPLYAGLRDTSFELLNHSL